MVTYCAACGNRISRPKGSPRYGLDGDHCFLCPECGRLAASPAGPSALGADSKERAFEEPPDVGRD